MTNLIIPILKQYRHSLVSDDYIAKEISKAVLKERMEKIKEQNKQDMELRQSKLFCQDVIPKPNNPNLG
jgi:hypothetical protein